MAECNRTRDQEKQNAGARRRYDPEKERERRTRRRQANPDCFRLPNKKWRAANREQANTASRTRKRATADILKIKNAEYRRANKDKIDQSNRSYRERNREKMCAASERWRRANPGKVNARTARRTAAKLCATPPWADLGEIAKFYIEAARLTSDTGIPHEVDHIYPLQGKTSCGLHIPCNLRVITKTENRSKQNRIPKDHEIGPQS